MKNSIYSNLFIIYKYLILLIIINLYRKQIEISKSTFSSMHENSDIMVNAPPVEDDLKEYSQKLQS